MFDLIAALEEIVRRHPRYKLDAYLFVREALAYTQKMLGTSGHVTGRQLLEGIRRYALETFGPCARMVLEGWGVRRTEDFGAIVFNMVDAGLLGKRDEDSIMDFSDGYDFVEAFDHAYRQMLERRLSQGGE